VAYSGQVRAFSAEQLTPLFSSDTTFLQEKSTDTTFLLTPLFSDHVVSEERLTGFLGMSPEDWLHPKHTTEQSS
jgi:hypothetical protein